MKRLAVSVTTAAAVAVSALGLGVVAQPALANGGLSVTIASAGTKKVDVSWADGTALASGPFDAYLVTLDNDSGTTPDTADRSRFVDPAANPLETRFEDLNSNTAYYASVYAVDFTDTGFDVVPATGQPADTPLGIDTGNYSPLTLTASVTKVLSGKSVTLSGVLKDANGDPVPGESVKVLRDTYPQFGGVAGEQSATTDTNGRWSVTSPALTENTWFWAEFRPADDLGGWTGRVLVEVRKKFSVQVDPGLTVDAGANVKFTGDTKGDPEFLDDANVKVCLQRLQGGSWSKLFCRAVEPSGEYSLSFKPGANADGKYRVFSGMGPAYADSWSATKKLVVR